jgi:hypothetical protein
MTWNAIVPGTYTVGVLWRGGPIGDPFSVTSFAAEVASAATSLTASQLKMEGNVSSSVEAGRGVVVEALPTDAFGNVQDHKLSQPGLVQATWQEVGDPNAVRTPMSVLVGLGSGGGGGVVYKVGYTPVKAGRHVVVLVLGGVRAMSAAPPFIVTVVPAAIFLPNSLLSGGGVASATAGAEARVEVALRDRFGNPTGGVSDVHGGGGGLQCGVVLGVNGRTRTQRTSAQVDEVQAVEGACVWSTERSVFLGSYRTTVAGVYSLSVTLQDLLTGGAEVAAPLPIGYAGTTVCGADLDPANTVFMFQNPPESGIFQVCVGGVLHVDGVK